MVKRKEQLCWRCQNAYAGKCCWFDGFIPVPGWNARKTKIKQNGEVVTKSYLISRCPNFASDKRLSTKPKTNKQISIELGISERTFYRRKIKEGTNHDKT